MAQIDDGTDATTAVNATGFTDAAPSADAATPKRFGSYGPQPQSQFVADVNAAGQGLIAGAGQGIRAAGEKVQAIQRGDAEQKLDIVNRILSGQGMSAPPIGSTGNEPEFATQAAYADMSPDDLRKAKAGLEAAIAGPLSVPAPGSETGANIISAAQKSFPVDANREGLQTKVIGGAAGSVPALLAGTAGGLIGGVPGAIAGAGAVMAPGAYDSAYQDALAKGATPDQADAAATKSSAIQTGIQSIPLGRVASIPLNAAMKLVPEPMRNAFTQAVARYAQQGLEFSGANAASKFAENFVAQNTYDPKRDLMDGVGQSAEIGALTGPVIGASHDAAHAAVAHAIDVASPIASRTYLAAQAKLRDLAGDQAPAQPVVGSHPAAEARDAAQPQPPEPAPPVAAERQPSPAPDQPGAAVSSAPAEPVAPTVSAPNPYAMVRPGDLTLDPKRFQYKASDPDTGVTGALSGVKRWEPALADPIDAYRDTDGKLYVVNGHQRTDLATRAEAAGQPDVQIPARIYDAQDGYTPEAMRALGAYRNIAQGSGTAIDAAKVLRAPQPEGFTLPELPPKSSLVQQGQGLAKLSDDAFGAVVNGVIPAPFAAEVGKAITDPAQQMAAISVLHRADPPNVEQARIIVDDVKNSGFLSGTQDDMFGSQAFAQSLFPERARVLGQALQTLRGNKRVFKAAVEGEGALTDAGNTMDTASNLEGQTENERIIDSLQRNATSRGSLSDLLSAAARDVASGKQVRGAAADFLGKARALVRSGQADSLQPSPDPERAGSTGESGAGDAGPATDDVGPPQDGPGLFSARAGAPPVNPGSVRFYHGSKGEDPTSGGARFVTTDPVYARDFRSNGTPNAVHYVDLPKDHPLVAEHEDEGAPGTYAHFEVPPEMAKNLKPIDAPPIATADPARVQSLAQSIMRYTGAGKDVALHLVNSLDGGRADGSYANKLVTFALDTKPADVPGKLFHEVVHAMRDPALGLLKPGERAALDQAAFRYLKQGTNRADIMARYGDDAAVIHEEAIARMGEEALARAESQPPLVGRVAARMVNFVRGLGQALRGQGFKTADDVFRSMMRGDRAEPEEHAALADQVAGSGRAPSAGQTIPEAAAQVRAATPDTYFARRPPRMDDKQALEREGQGSMFGRQDAAVQAQAARDAVGGLRSDAPQKAADEGLFASREKSQGALFSLRPGAEKRSAFPKEFPHVVVQQPFGASRPTAHLDYRAAKAGDDEAAARFVVDHVTPQGLAAIQKMASGTRPTLVPVHAEEASGRNAIPRTYATYLSRKLNLPVLRDIVQSNRALRTGASQMHRMTTPVEFEGPVIPGTHYLLVDDHVSQGGTLADLRAYIENRGGKVIGATSLTGAPDAHILAATPETIDALRSKMPGIDEWVKGAFGHDLEGLTELETRYLARSNSLNSLRNQFATERSAPGGGEVAPDLRQVGSGGEGKSGERDVAAPEPGAKPDQQYSIRDDGRDAQGRFPLPPGPMQTKVVEPRLPAAPMPEPVKGLVRQAFEDIKDRAVNGAREVSDSIFPMKAGSKEAQTVAFKFANALRGIQYRYRKLDTMLTAQFTPEERSAMGRALDGQSVFEQQLRDNLKQMPAEEHAAHEQDARQAFDASEKGLAGLSDSQRATVEALNGLSQATWNRMAARGIVKPGAEGLPYYMPRAFVMADAKGARRITSQDRTPDLAGPRIDGGGGPGGDGPSTNGFHQLGRNLTTSGPKARQYLTPEESSAAAKAKFGNGAELVTDIRSLLTALSRNERAIAGRDLVDAIARYGEAAHEPAVAEGINPDTNRFFTLADHPSLSRWQPKIVQNEDGSWGAAKAPDGGPVFERAPIHISHDFKGPLSAVLTDASPSWYKGLMQVKSVGMHSIMFSPFIHLAVEIGRALPAMPGKVITGRVFVDGHRGLSDDAFMGQAIKDGLAPIAQGWSQDPASIADDQINPHGKNPLVRAIGGAKDTVARNMERLGGQFLGDAICDPHQALLWRNVLKLQVGIYKNARDAFMAKGLPVEAAGVAAAHVANRYAGALPPENLHRYANMLANLTMFSRSFTLGNLGVMKDALTGAPSHILAAVEAAGGDRATAQNLLARKAKTAVIMDIGLHYVGTAILQGAFAAAAGAGTLGLAGAIGQAYAEWRDKAAASLAKVGENPLEAFGVLPQHFNEPGKQDRAFLGTDASGRGEYARLMFGKVGEEMLGWLTKPGTMIASKENPLLSGLEDVIRNQDSLGRKIMPPDVHTMGDWLRDAGLVANHLFSGFLPMQAINDVRDMASDLRTKEAATQLAGQMLGVVQMSSGFPGGPQAGVERAEKERADFEWQATMPAAHRLMQAGDRAGAEALIKFANLSDIDKAQMTARLDRAPGPSRSQFRKFVRGAMPAEQDSYANVNR